MNGGLFVRFYVFCERVSGFEGFMTEGTFVRFHSHVTIAYVGKKTGRTWVGRGGELSIFNCVV